MNAAPATDRPYTPRELAADAAIHGLGVLFAVIAGPILIAMAAARGEAPAVVAVSIYAVALLAVFVFSAFYNFVSAPRWRESLRRLDHSAIYFKIAGSYTPFAAVSLAGGVGQALLIAVWAVAGVGMALKLAAPRRFEAASVPVYLGLGWAFVWVGADARAALAPEALALLVAGGLLYSLGVGFHLWRRLPYQNAIWHLFVLGGTACIYAAIAVEIA
ncbi:MAG: hemolysin III family protein [Rubrimonas sp.]|uniref:PAQR family membrane homeostasis protein TrhA n=1 Tax=Rubrimonas sp. TaxID=2036015 RepID=UPI002FDDEAA5